MEVERRLQEILSIDPLSPIDIPSGELSENPAFFIPLHINYIKQDAEALNLHSRHFHRAPITSGLHRKADIFGVCRHVSKVPLSDIRPVQGPSVTRSNRNEIDGANEEIEWHGQALETFTQ